MQIFISRSSSKGAAKCGGKPDGFFPKSVGSISSIRLGKSPQKHFARIGPLRKERNENFKGDWMNFLSVPFKVNRSDIYFLLAVEPGSKQFKASH